MVADAQLALPHQVTITLGGQVLSENWELLIRLKRKCLNIEVSKNLMWFANTDFDSFSSFSFFLLCVFLFLAQSENRKRDIKDCVIEYVYIHILIVYICINQQINIYMPF